MSEILSTQIDLLNQRAAYKKRGNEFLAKGQLEEAAASYRQALAIDPGYAEAYLNLGFVLREQQLFDEAERTLRQALSINPKMEDAYYILGTVLQGKGDLNGMIENFSKALELKPGFEIIYRDLCHALFQTGQTEKALQVIQQGIALNPEVADFHYYLGNLYVHDRQLEQAISCYRKALSIQPDYAAVCSNMGKAFIELGEVDEAVACYRKAVSLDAAVVSVEAKSSLLFAQNYDARYSPGQYLADAKRYGSEVLAQARPYAHWSVETPGRSEPRLRVGLVSGDFLEHPVGFFLENILAHLNPGRIELLAYPTQQEEDALTARIKPRFAAWHSIAGLSDEAAARKIHADGVHILIDLAGHTSHNRLPVFAWKPAPVQVSWLGYFATTGVPGMDYLLADRISVPESHRDRFTEAIWYLPDTRLCFTPPSDSTGLALTPPPVMRNGYITFGCFQNVGKLNDAVLSVWGRILSALPQARLRVQNPQMNYPAVREDLLRRLGRAGVARERVTMAGPMPREDYLAAHADVDIILDTFPYQGGTTTCEALWMGVPTLTLAGDSMHALQGAVFMTCAGLPEWIAADEEDYVARALVHASDVPRLTQLRAGLRQQVLASPLFDGPRFARNFEDALQGMWQHFQSLNSSHTHHV